MSVLPPFQTSGNLPPGLHHATWDEVVARFGTTAHRRRLLEGLLRALQSLRQAGCSVAYLDGSFVTSREVPGDFDACWAEEGVDPDKLDPVLKIFDDGRALQKAKFFGELFPASIDADFAGTLFIDFFQVDKNTGDPKGIVVLELQGLPDD